MKSDAVSNAVADTIIQILDEFKSDVLNGKEVSSAATGSEILIAVLIGTMLP